MVFVQEFLRLNASRSPGSQCTEKLINHSVVAVSIVRHDVGVEKSCGSMAQELAVPIGTVIIQSLKQCGGSIHLTGFRSECLGDLGVDVKKRGPLLGVLRPIPKTTKMWCFMSFFMQSQTEKAKVSEYCCQEKHVKRAFREWRGLHVAAAMASSSD